MGANTISAWSAMRQIKEKNLQAFPNDVNDFIIVSQVFMQIWLFLLLGCYAVR